MNWLHWTIWFGTAVFAASGVLASRTKRLDFFGVIVIASVTALGGGTLRDVLLGSHPISWIGDPTILWVTSGVGAFTFFLARSLRESATTSLLLYVSDAVGLAVFSIVGTAKTLSLGESPLIAIVMGVITGAAGGLIRDLLVGEVPLILKREIYATAFEVDPNWLVECASRRQKWIDQAQSLNIYMAGASGKKLHETYTFAWLRGLKTTYYLRTQGATHAEKSTTDRLGQLNAVSAEGAAGAFSYGAQSPASAGLAPVVADDPIAPKFCAIEDPDCEACQ